MGAQGMDNGNVLLSADRSAAPSIVTRIRNRINDAPMETERLLDEAADTIEDLCLILHRNMHVYKGGAQ